MALIGREEEIWQLEDAANSDRPELVVVYGRRRVGKTYLVNRVFQNRLDFAHTGLSPLEVKNLKEENKDKTILELQLLHFYHSLIEFGYKGKSAPKNWLEAFLFLSLLLLEKKSGRKQIVFIDELPWLDTPKSFFLTAFESFCNGYANRENLLIITAGSAISYLLRKVLSDHGGLYDRVTREIPLSPFSLRECELLLKDNRVDYSRYDIARVYMVFGGIPYYLNYIARNSSFSQNVDNLFFSKKAPLAAEFEKLFSSSFDNAKVTSSIVKALASTRIGLTRSALCKAISLPDGEVLNEGLKALLASGYIIKYAPLQEGGREHYYKLVDPFCLFYLHFVEGKTSMDEHFYADNENDNSLQAWKGFAFENICYNHLETIKSALGIRGVATSRFSFLSKANASGEGAQIDLVLERKDNIVTLCEMKFYSEPYAVSESDELDLARKKNVLSTFIKKKQTIGTALISTYGIKSGKHQWAYQNIVTLDDLFQK